MPVTTPGLGAEPQVLAAGPQGRARARPAARTAGGHRRPLRIREIPAGRTGECRRQAYMQLWPGAAHAPEPQSWRAIPSGLAGEFRLAPADRPLTADRLPVQDCLRSQGRGRGAQASRNARLATAAGAAL